jgi:23S rRNA (adenine-N6)-dimethyltransferase
VSVERSPSRRARGQHFLRTRRLAADLVAAAGIRPGDLVLDLGAGTGMLTSALVEAGARVIAVERDDALAASLRSRFGDRVTVVEDDAERLRLPREPFAVVSNLPFARSGGILAHLLGDPRVQLRRADVVVQWELAAKHAAVWPATLRATYWRAWYDVSIARRLDRCAFAPPPSVDAAVLRIERRAQPRVPLEAHAAYRRFLTAAFESRRPLRRSLPVRRLAPALGFAPDAAARDLDAEQWAALFSACASRRG